MGPNDINELEKIPNASNITFNNFMDEAGTFWLQK